MQRLLLSSALVLFLAGCLPSVPSETPPSLPPVVLEPTKPQGEDATTEPTASGSVTATGATTMERLLPNGVLEIGDRNAPLVLVSFTEHNCRYCKEFWEKVVPELLAREIADGTLRYDIVILPLQKYPHSKEASAALLCAATQGKGMAMHDTLFRRLAKSDTDLLAYATELSVDANLFSACIQSADTAAMIEDQELWARSLDVTLVPTFFLNGEKSVGLPTLAGLRGRIELAKAALNP